MLRKVSGHSDYLQPGREVFLITRDRRILEGFKIASVLFDQVMLEPAPLPDSPKQGFTLEGDLLKPNWCAGRKAFRAACFSKQEALELTA